MMASIAPLLGRRRVSRVGSLLAFASAIWVLVTLMFALLSPSPVRAGLLTCGDFPACAGQACPVGFECTNTGGPSCFCVALPTPTATTTPTPAVAPVPATSSGGLGIALILLIAVSAFALAQRRRTS